MKAKLFGSAPEAAQRGWYKINCPACRFEHLIAVDTPFSNGAQWTFNRNLEKPTFDPSINIKYGPSEDGVIPMRVCHFFVKEGKIEYYSDCTHSEAGKTLDLPDVDEV